METNYPTLRRPKRKLCYLTNKESVSERWTADRELRLEDVDKLFDDLDSPSSEGNLSPAPSSLLQTFDIETNDSKRQSSPVPQDEHLTTKHRSPKGDVVLPAGTSPRPKVDINLDTSFQVHGPVKTSSPIEKNVVAEGVEEEDNEKRQVVSPILFDCEDGEQVAKTETEPQSAKKPQFNEHDKDERDELASELESPPSNFTFGKPMMSSHKNKVEQSREQSQSVKGNTQKTSQTAVLEGKRKIPRQKKRNPPVSPVREEPELAAPEKHSHTHSQPATEMSTRVGKDMTAFLQKLRDAGQCKPARKSLSPVKVPALPPEPEDDFLILEDDAPLRFAIPSKTATSRRQKLSRTSSTDKDTSADKGTKNSPLETAQKGEESEKANAKVGIQPVNQKMKKKKGKDKKNEVTGPDNDKNELNTPEDLAAGDLVDQEKPNKKKQQRLKKIPSKESDKAQVEESKDTASRETEEEGNKKTQKSSELKSSKSPKENAKTSRTKSSKGTRKVRQGSEDIKDTVYDEAVKEQSQEENNKKYVDVEDLKSLSDKEIMNCDAQTAKDVSGGKAKRNQLPVSSEGSSSQGGQILGKRKRKQTGQWWACCPQSTEESKVTDIPSTLKKSKQHRKEPSAAEPSPAKAKKERALKKRDQEQPAPSSKPKTINAKGRKTTRNKNSPARGDTADKTKATDELLNTPETEQSEEQQREVPDEDLDPVQSSPLVFAHLSVNSGDQVFHRVYPHVPREKKCSTPAHVSPRKRLEQVRAAEPEKRRRKAPGNWWAVDSMSEDVESISSQPQQLYVKETKSRRDRKMQSTHCRSPGLGTPKNGNLVVSSKPQRGAHVSPLKLKHLSAPKTIKRSLATFKDIFTSGAETPAVVSGRGTLQHNRYNVTESPVEEVADVDCVTRSKTDKNERSMGVGEARSTQNSPPNGETPQDSNCQRGSMLKDLRSGPSSMIVMEQYEKNDDSILQSSGVAAVLSVSDLCAPPLKPLILQQKDKDNLAEWFKSLWSTTVNNGAEITPDQFDWYVYQGRAIGLHVDLNHGTICNGKILLGSYMKKPLWVDHSATTVFNLLTSSVIVTIDGKKSNFNPGQSFMVRSGHAYSIQNITAQPAVLYFTRVSAESSE